MQTTHVDFSEMVIAHHQQTESVLFDVYLLSDDCLKELIDAIPNCEVKLISKLLKIQAVSGAK